MDEVKTKEDIEKHVRKIIEHLRPYIMGDGGDIEFVSYDNDIVTVRLLGACVGCSLIDVTLNNGIKNWIMEEIPSVKDVVLVQDTFQNEYGYDNYNF